jgi:hypothetical protein
MSGINILDNNNIDIFANTIMKEPNTSNQENEENNVYNDIQKYEMNNERNKMKLSLRKKRLDEKLFYKRKIEYINSILSKDSDTFHFENFIVLDEPFTELISRLDEEYKDQNRLKLLLKKICYVIRERCKKSDTILIEKIFNFTVDDLIENHWIDNLYQLILNYLKNSEIMELITRILYLSSVFMLQNYSNNNNELYDQNGKVNINGYFISADKYIDLYNKIFEVYIKENNKVIIQFMTIFIAEIAENEKSNQDNLYISGTLNYIIDSIDFEKDELQLLDTKIWCLSKFELDAKFDMDLDLALKIQKVYINLFLNQKKFNLYEGMNKEMDQNNIFYNFLKLIENTSFCTQIAYIENLLKYNILEFLMDNVNINNQNMLSIIIYIFINLTNAETSQLKRFIDIGVVKFMENIILDKNICEFLKNNALITINNLLYDSQLWNRVLYDQGIIKIFCVILNDKNISPNIFSEICYGIYNVLPFCDFNDLKIIIDHYFIIQLICQAMKNILLNDKSFETNHFSIFESIILKLMENYLIYDDLKEDILVKFGSVNGIEIIDQIINKCNYIDINNYKQNENDDIKDILKMAEIIRDKAIKV